MGREDVVLERKFSGFWRQNTHLCLKMIGLSSPLCLLDRLQLFNSQKYLDQKVFSIAKRTRYLGLSLHVFVVLWSINFMHQDTSSLSEIRVAPPIPSFILWICSSTPRMILLSSYLRIGLTQLLLLHFAMFSCFFLEWVIFPCLFTDYLWMLVSAPKWI